MIEHRFLKLGEMAKDDEPCAIAIANNGKKEWAKLQYRYVLAGPHLIGSPVGWQWSDWKDVPIE